MRAIPHPLSKPEIIPFPEAGPSRPLCLKKPRPPKRTGVPSRPKPVNRKGKTLIPGGEKVALPEKLFRHVVPELEEKFLVPEGLSHEGLVIDFHKDIPVLL